MDTTNEVLPESPAPVITNQETVQKPSMEVSMPENNPLEQSNMTPIPVSRFQQLYSIQDQSEIQEARNIIDSFSIPYKIASEPPPEHSGKAGGIVHFFKVLGRLLIYFFHPPQDSSVQSH